MKVIFEQQELDENAEDEREWRVLSFDLEKEIEKFMQKLFLTVAQKL
jgi:hypothetical protein